VLRIGSIAAIYGAVVLIVVVTYTKRCYCKSTWAELLGHNRRRYVGYLNGIPYLNEGLGFIDSDSTMAD
jgi:hypothetical protein